MMTRPFTTWPLTLILPLLLFGCAAGTLDTESPGDGISLDGGDTTGSGDGDTDTDSDSDSGADTDTDSDADADADADADTNGDSSAPVDTGTPVDTTPVDTGTPVDTTPVDTGTPVDTSNATAITLKDQVAQDLGVGTYLATHTDCYNHQADLNGNNGAITVGGESYTLSSQTNYYKISLSPDPVTISVTAGSVNIKCW